MNKKRILVLGFMGACPIAGVIWQHLHYIVGLQRLGHEVYYIEDTNRYPYNPVKFDINDDFSYAIKTIDTLARHFDFEGRWSYCARYREPFEIVGIQRQGLLDLYRNCDSALNICGSHALNEDLALIENLLYIESDPGVEQIKVDKGETTTIEYLNSHSHLFTFGENVGGSRFAVPLNAMTWLPTRQPIVTDLWCRSDEAAPVPDDAPFTTICNWSTGGKKDIIWRGSTYCWSKSSEFIRFIEAPRRSGEPFLLATDIRDETQRRQFVDNNWRLILPHEMSVNWGDYKDFICSSRGEFTCAKDQYVRLNTGWFSDRSACYLAAGRPVITQATGFELHYGGNKGLFAFSSIEEIAEAVAAIRVDYKLHSRGALEIARECFEAEKVLSSLLERASV